MLATTIHEFPIPTASSGATWITTGPDGNLWFTENIVNQLASINPATHVFTLYPIPISNSGPTSITTGPDGNLWFIEANINEIGQFNPTTHVFAAYPIPIANSGAANIISGPDGNLWFVETKANNVAEFSPTTHIFTTFPIPIANSGANSITTGPDGNLWFTESNANAIGQFNPTTAVFAAFPIPTASSGANSITTGSDGNLWFTESSSNKIGEINPTTHVVTEFPVPTASSGLAWITTGSDGDLWFTENNTSQIGQLSPTTHSFTTLAIPTANSGPTIITSGPDGNLWFIETNANKIAQVAITPTPPTPPPAKKQKGVVVIRPKIETTTQLTAAPNPAIVGQVITLTATVTIVEAATPTGTVTFFIDGQAQPPVQLAAQNGAAQATLSTKLAAATHIITAIYKGNSTLAASVSNAVSLVVAPAPGDGPTVVQLARFGFHSRPTTLVLTFDKALDPTRAQDLQNYRLINSHGKPVRITSAVYNASALTVTLRPARRLNIHHEYQLTVVGTGPTGLTDTNGNLLDGADTGHPGSDYVASITLQNLVIAGQPLARSV